MRQFGEGRFRQQVKHLQHQFLQDGNLPFSDILSTDVIEQALTALKVGWVDCVYTPLVTLCVFLGQVLSADHSCRAAVARLIAYRVARKERACSPETSAYCQARKRLPEKFFSQIAKQTGQQLDTNAKLSWLWKSRQVYIFDGATVSMPDTRENQQAYPQPPQQKPGLGFPLMRIAVVFSLACGAVLDVGTCRYAGKGQSELGLLRQMWSIFQPGSIMLADRLMCAWTELVMLKQRDVDCVCRFTSHRKTDFRRGQRLGDDDHIVTWIKPMKPRTIDRKTYDTLPDSLTIRECRVRLTQPGFRVRVLVIATTLLDHIAYPPSELAELYRARWHAELDLRSLKQTMLSRQDNENIFLMYSDMLHFWHTKELILKPTFPWEFVQLGNCGSPIETEAGWLVLSHGVGPMRKYSMGAFLLDLDNPARVIGRMSEPLLTPNENEREGYVPNVVYSCGAALHGRELIIPYAMADYASSFATVSLDEVLHAIKPC